MLLQLSLLERLLRFEVAFSESDHNFVSFQTWFYGPPTDNSLELKMLATLPSHQRRGVAALQLGWATDLADEKRLTCWVEGSAVAVPLYRKFGFDVKDTIVSQCSGLDGEIPYVSTCMLRELRQ